MVRNRWKSMTEDEWLECHNSAAMLEFVRPKATKRKLRLFAAASFRRLTHLLPDSRQQHAIEMLENVTDETEFPRGIGQGARMALPPSADSYAGKCADDPYYVGLMLYREFMSSSTACHATAALNGLADHIAEQMEQCRLLRCIFGPLPFRPIVFDDAWRTPAAVAQARAIYEEKAFDRLPILGTTLREAGCHDTSILDHCRQPGPHVRGCWVVDMLLGRS